MWSKEDRIKTNCPPQEYLVFAVAVLVLSAYLSVEYYSIRTIVLDPHNKHYSLYRGTMLTATEHCHNIYVRLHCKRTGEEKTIVCILILFFVYI